MGKKELKQVLRGLHAALAPGGRLLPEPLNVFQVAYEGASCEVLELGPGELMVDRRQFDAESGRQHCDRTVTRPGRAPMARHEGVSRTPRVRAHTYAAC